LAIEPISALLAAPPQHVVNCRKRPVPDALSEFRYQVALANRMLANEGVLDAFGHVSLRHPTDPGRYLLSRSRSPGLIEPADILEFTLDSDPVAPPTVKLYAERVKRCRSGTSATSSATPTCWWSSRRRAAHSRARSAHTALC
jgi:hypothetical protein